MQMRLNKVSELIHNSTNHQNLDSAGVSVHFQEINDLVKTFFHLYFDLHSLECSGFYISNFCLILG